MNESPSNYESYRNNPEALLGILVEKEREHTRQLEEFKRHINLLEKALLELKRAQFAPKSERRPLGVDEQQLFPLREVVTPELPAPEITVPAHTRAARTKRDLSKLPQVTVEHEPVTKSCSCCGAELIKIGADTSKELEYEPAKLFVINHVRPRYGCNSCKMRVVQALLPSGVKPLERSIAGAGLLTQVLVSKYVDHIPLHRQEQIFARKGFEIPRRSLCNWVEGSVSEYLERLWGELKKEVFTESYLQGDETTLKVQDNDTPGKCHTGYLWGALSPEQQLIYFEYAPSRAGAVAKDIFAEFRGTLQTDLYAGYNAVLLPDKVTRIACLAHVRRKFIEAEGTAPAECTVVLKLLAELYRLEKQWRVLSPEERLLKRQRSSRSILVKMHQYLLDLEQRMLPKAKLMEALSYTLKQWREIEGIFEDGRFELDNNSVEREMRPIALGRKNYLFAGSHDGARRAAIIYSLLGTARLHKVNPTEWLKFVFTRMQDHPVNKLGELLPHRFLQR